VQSSAAALPAVTGEDERAALMLAFQRAAVINAALLKLRATRDSRGEDDTFVATIEQAIRALERASTPSRVRAVEEHLAAAVRDRLDLTEDDSAARDSELHAAVALLVEALVQLHDANSLFAEQVLDHSDRMQKMVVHDDLAKLRARLTEELQDLRKATRAKREAEKREMAALRARVGTLEERMQVVAVQARFDALTGLYNRAAWEEQLSLIESEEHGAFAVAVLDLDGFKRINDAAGHAAGDAALAAFGSYCRQAFGMDDFVARIGGDEFAVLVAAPDRDHAVNHVERLLDFVRRASASPESCGHVPFTASAGLALTRADEGVRDQLSRADAALYAAKRAGRNRLIVTAV
jgi:diguanylate cyclase (GGDEF)-like protein